MEMLKVSKGGGVEKNLNYRFHCWFFPEEIFQAFLLSDWVYVAVVVLHFFSSLGYVALGFDGHYIACFR